MAQTKIEQGLLKFTEATDYLKIPTGTTAQRPGSPVAGYIRFNTTIGAVETYDGTGWVEIGVTPPTFSSVDYPGSATALDPAGGESLVINGTTFNVGITVTIDGTTPSSITRNSENQLTVTAPAKTAGTYNIVFTNTDGGTATAINAVSYNGVPAFTNAAGSLGSVKSGDAISVSAAATEPDGGAITYAVTSGSLPSGATLNTTTGAITGTAPSVNADTTSNFTITATDNENQSTARAYSITITPILPSDSFQVVTFTGNGGTQSITGVGFKPDFVWIKERSAAESHRLFDTTRGANKRLFSNNSNAESIASDSLTSFDADGFSLGSSAGINENSQTYVAWCWKSNGGTTSSNTDGSITSTVQANTDAGFSIATWDGSGSSASIGHGLGVAPDMLLVKNLDGTNSWIVRHKDFDGYLSLELSAAGSSSDVFGTAPDTTKYYFNTAAGGNGYLSGNTYVGYFFAGIDGFSKFGSYTGNGSEQLVETGFEPAFVITKSTSATGHWRMYDNKRGSTDSSSSYVGNRKVLYGDLDIAEGAGINEIRFLSNGFEVGPGNNTNTNGVSFIYMAFAADPDTTAPTLADSFSTVTYTGTGADNLQVTGVGFQPNMSWIKSRNGAYAHNIYDSVRGASKRIQTNLTNAESNISGVKSFDSDGFTLGNETNDTNFTNGNTYVAWNWKADDNEPTIFSPSPSQTVDDIKSTNLTLNLNLAGGSYSGSGNAIEDLSSAEEDFTVTNATIPSGFGGYYIDFDGSGDYADSDSSIATTSGNDITIEFWIKPESATQAAYASIMDANHSTAVSGSTGQGWCIQQTGSTNNSYYFVYYDGSTYQSNSDAQLFTLTNGVWSHIAIVKSGTSIQVYKDGSAGTSWTAGNGNLANPNQKIRLGGFLAGGRDFNGNIAQVRLYSDALSSSEVTANYNATKGLFTTIESIVSANANAGFSIVKYEGNGTNNATVGHGLSATPDLVIHKNLTSVSSWRVASSALANTNGYLKLESTVAESTNLGNDGSITKGSLGATTITLTAGAATSNNINASGSEYIMYCFHSVSGYSKIGSYTGNGSSSGPIVTTGFQPDWIMIKSSSLGTAWMIIDSVRGTSLLLQPQSGAVEQNVGTPINFTSTGFQITDTNDSRNQSGATYIYMAFKIN